MADHKQCDCAAAHAEGADPARLPGLLSLADFVAARLEQELRGATAYAELIGASPRRYGKTRARREVATWQAITKLATWHSGRHVCEDGLAGTRWDDEADDIVEAPCDELRVLGEIWADHSDYRPEWRSDGH